MYSSILNSQSFTKCIKNNNINKNNNNENVIIIKPKARESIDFSKWGKIEEMPNGRVEKGVFIKSNRKHRRKEIDELIKSHFPKENNSNNNNKENKNEKEGENNNNVKRGRGRENAWKYEKDETAFLFSPEKLK
jgi:hypothetical protein